MQEKNLENVLALKKEQLNTMDFKSLIACIRLIDEYFRNTGQLDVEMSLKAYQKAIQLLTAARTKLVTLKKEKEKLDSEYASFLDSLSRDSQAENYEEELETEDLDTPGKLPF